MLAPLTLALAISRCTVAEPPLLRAAQVGVVDVESTGHAWAIHDDNDGIGYYPTSYAAAVALATRLVAHDRAIHGRGVDLGIAQIDDANLTRYGLTIASALLACPNLHASSIMLTRIYGEEQAALANVPDPQRSWAALDRTLRVYNSGSAHGPIEYTVAVEAALEGHYVEEALADLGTLPPVAPDMHDASRAIARSPRASSLMFGSDLVTINPPPAHNGVIAVPPRR